MRSRDSATASETTRRNVLRASLGAGIAAGTGLGASTAAAQEEEGGGQDAEPDWGDWFEDVPNYEGTEDLRGEDEVTVDVGAGDDGLQFAPPAIWVDPGTTVRWVWQSDTHNVAPRDVPEGAGWEGYPDIDDEGTEYEHTFEGEGQYTYVCEPHEGAGMKGAVAVGEQAAGGEGEGFGVPPLGLYLVAALVVAFLSPLIFAVFLYRSFSSPETSPEAGHRRGPPR